MAHQSKISALQSLSADILATSSPSAIAELLSRDLAPLLGASSVRLYLFKASNRSLESVLCSPAVSNGAEPVATSVDHPAEGIIAAAVRCFRQGSVVNIPRLRRDESVNPDGKKGYSGSAVFAPVLLNQKSLGVIEALRTTGGFLGKGFLGKGFLGKNAFGSFDGETIALLKLIAAQTAAALELQQYSAAQHRLAQSEQLAANAQLIANAAANLRPRMERVLNLFCELPEALQADSTLCDAREETLHAAEDLTRLTSFAGLDNGGSEPAGLSDTRVEDRAAGPPDSPLDVNVLLSELIHFRSAHWNTLALRIQNHLQPEMAIVMGQRGQLEHAFLDMAIHAERATAASSTKLLSISTQQLAGRVLVQFLFPAGVNSASNTSSSADPTDANSSGTSTGDNDASLKLCQQIANRHHGEFQLRSQTDTEGFDLALEMDLPLLAAREKSAAGHDHLGQASEHPLTLLLVDPDPAARKQLLGIVGQRGHRVIPVAPEETPTLAQRMRFDGILWAVRSGGPKWSDYQQRLRDLIPAFILISSGYDSALATSLSEGGGYLLSRPVEDAELDRILDKLTANCAVQV